MPEGVIPSPEFNEQIKRTVRETLRRERSQQRPVGRWHKKGGGSGGGGNCCCCATVVQPDTTLSTGIETVTVRELCVRLGNIAVPQAHGWLTVTFPETTSMRLERQDNPVTDDFVWDIPSSAFSAVYNDGTDATSDLTSPSGTVTFSPYVAGADANCDCPMMRMRIEFDVTIPEPEGVEEP